MAAGTCATYGGIHAMQGNPTGCMRLADYLGWNWRSHSGLQFVKELAILVGHPHDKSHNGSGYCKNYSASHSHGAFAKATVVIAVAERSAQPCPEGCADARSYRGGFQDMLRINAIDSENFITLHVHRFRTAGYLQCRVRQSAELSGKRFTVLQLQLQFIARLKHPKYRPIIAAPIVAARMKATPITTSRWKPKGSERSGWLSGSNTDGGDRNNEG